MRGGLAPKTPSHAGVRLGYQIKPPPDSIGIVGVAPLRLPFFQYLPETFTDSCIFKTVIESIGYADHTTPWAVDMGTPSTYRYRRNCCPAIIFYFLAAITPLLKPKTTVRYFLIWE